MEMCAFELALILNNPIINLFLTRRSAVYQYQPNVYDVMEFYFSMDSTDDGSHAGHTFFYFPKLVQAL